MINLNFPNWICVRRQKPGLTIAVTGLYEFVIFVYVCLCKYVSVQEYMFASKPSWLCYIKPSLWSRLFTGFNSYISVSIASTNLPNGRDSGEHTEGSRLFECFYLQINLFILFIISLFSTLLPCCGDSTCQIFLSYWMKLQRTCYPMFSFIPVAYCSTTVKHFNPASAFGFY